MINIFTEYIKDLKGKIGIYYKNLETGETVEVNSRDIFTAASIIKLPILIEVLSQYKEGRLDIFKRVELESQDQVPSSGVLNCLDPGLRLSLRDLYTLMIVVSDNTATNMLIDMVGMKSINQTMEKLGYKNIRLNRKMMDFSQVDLGLDNHISPIEIGEILERVYNGSMIDEETSREIERVLKLQKINHKLPYLIEKGIEIGHKTGENEGVSHDAGIIYTKNPFILSFFSNNTNVVETERAMQKIAQDLAIKNSN